LPLLVVVYLLHSMRNTDDADPVMIDMLVQELIADRSKLLLGPSPAPALPSIPPPVEHNAASSAQNDPGSDEPPTQPKEEPS